MRSSICLLLVAAAAIAVPGTAAGYTCYLVYDRNGNTIYQAMSPPVDMSDRGKAEREALRSRGELLLIIDTERCAPLTYVMGSGGTHAINFDNALAGVPEALPSTMGSGAPPRQASGAATSRQGAPAAPAATGSSATKPYGK